MAHLLLLRKFRVKIGWHWLCFRRGCTIGLVEWQDWPFLMGGVQHIQFLARGNRITRELGLGFEKYSGGIWDGDVPKNKCRMAG